MDRSSPGRPLTDWQAAEELATEFADGFDTRAPDRGVQPDGPDRRIFVVHGHGDGLREMVVDFLTALGLKPVVLSRIREPGLSLMQKLLARTAPRRCGLPSFSPRWMTRARPLRR